MEDLLKGMMSGAGGQSGDEGQDDDPLAGMMGGGSGGQAGAMGGLMQALLGSGLGAGAQGGGIESILGSLLGGGESSAMANNPLVAPIAEALSKKLGLSQEIAEMVVGFALSKLLSGLLGSSAASGGRSPTEGGIAESRQLLAQMRSSDGVDPGYLTSTGLAQELAEQTGLDPDTAERSLQEAFNMLGTRMTTGDQPAPQQGPDLSQGLDGMLDL
jgi:hypothetical protein